MNRRTKILVALEILLVLMLLGLLTYHLYQRQRDRDLEAIEQTLEEEAAAAAEEAAKEADAQDDDSYFNVKETSPELDELEPGTQWENGFLVDNTLITNVGDIHFSSYVPSSYNGTESYALFITLPGYGGMYFQGVGTNLMEPFCTEAKNYNDKMIILSLQHQGWGEASANMTIELTEYYMANYNIDPNKVYIEGYAEGGETASIVMEKRPELYSACLVVSSKWDGNIRSVAGTQTPVYFVIGEDDSYADDESQSLTATYDKLVQLYTAQGLEGEAITRLAVLNVKNSSYFASYGYADSHTGGKAVASDPDIMGWLFGAH